MIAIIATLRIKDGQAAEFERIFTEMAEAVRRNEEGNRFYQLTRSRTETNTYRALEVYADEDALQAHRAAEHFKSLGAQLGPTLAGRPDIEYLDAVV
jgi:quinol monooxygenase YgiN